MNHNSVLLTHLVIRKLHPYLKDNRATEETQEHYKTQHGAARVNKRLYPVYALKAVDAAARAARDKHIKHTMPWYNDGTRALPAKLYMQYLQEMEESKTAFEQAVHQFVKEEPKYREQDKIRLASLYREEDYPHPDDLADYFSIDISISVVPDVQDIRFNLSETEAQKIKEQLEQQMQDAHQRWAKDLAVRLYKPMFQFSSKLDDPEGIFKNASVENLREIANVMKELNVMADPSIDTLADQVLADIVNHEPNTLRIDKATRAQTAANARKVISQLETLYGVAS
jgi:hypothetical protein